jgi:flagellar biogenesis protein FliO
MGMYLIQFGIYTLAMVGVIFVCLLVVKKTMSNDRFAKRNNELCIENVLNLSQRKTLYVVKAGGEKFLIAADTERTSFLAKLNESQTSHACSGEFHPAAAAAEKNGNVIDYGDVMASLSSTAGKKPIFRELIKKLNMPAS